MAFRTEIKITSFEQLGRTKINGWYLANRTPDLGEQSAHWACCKIENKLPVIWFDSLGYPTPRFIVRASVFLAIGNFRQGYESKAGSGFCRALIENDIWGYGTTYEKFTKFHNFFEGIHNCDKRLEYYLASERLCFPDDDEHVPSSD